MDSPSIKHFSQAFPKTSNQRNGMTLRDYFAAKAMQGYCSDPDWRMDMDHLDTAVASYSIADAMLKARDGNP